MQLLQAQYRKVSVRTLTAKPPSRPAAKLFVGRWDWCGRTDVFQRVKGTVVKSFSDGPGSFRATALHILLRYLDILPVLLTGEIVRNV
jgi:hypothetical protein